MGLTLVQCFQEQLELATSETNTNDKSDPGQKIIEELEEINSYLHNVNEVNLT